jgi:hypothetical protein
VLLIIATEGYEELAQVPREAEGELLEGEIALFKLQPELLVPGGDQERVGANVRVDITLDADLRLVEPEAIAVRVAVVIG